METPLSPLEFLRRARRLYPDYEAVVDEGRHFTYSEFSSRCDRWSAALQHLGVSKGDRVAYIAPNTHAQLESFYAVPQIGAVLVPINYRLVADDFVYIIGHSGATVICVHGDYLEAVEKIRHELPEVKHVVGTLIHISMSPADRYLWTLPMFHANGWTFVWIVTAVGGTHVCLRKVEPRAIFTQIRAEGITLLCAAPTVLIGIASESLSIII